MCVYCSLPACRDPSIKRTLCKSCDTILIPGVTCTQRLRCKLARISPSNLVKAISTLETLLSLSDAMKYC